VNDFAQWLSATGASVFIKTHAFYLIPIIQSVHILAIGIVFGSVFAICLRVLGLAAADQTMRQVNRRFVPWMHAALWVLAATGTLLIISEPTRELLAFSFWLKMTLLAIGVAVAVVFTLTVRAHEDQWDEALIKRAPVRAMAVVTLLVWAGVIVCGRLIAYDHVWGALSPSNQF